MFSALIRPARQGAGYRPLPADSTDIDDSDAMDSPLVQNQHDDTADDVENASDDRVVLTEEDVCDFLLVPLFK